MAGFFRRNSSWLVLALGTVGLPFLSLSNQEVTWVQMAGPYDQADVAVTIADTPDPIFGSSTVGNLTHVVSLTNYGPSTATGIGVGVTISLPGAGVTIESITPSVGTWSEPTWSISSLGVGSTATLTVVLSVSEAASSSDSIISDAVVNALIESDPDGSDNSASETTEIARVIRVDCTTSLAPDGTTWATAYASLMQAIDVAEWGDELWVAQCVYFPDNWAFTDNDVHATFGLKSGVKIFGGFTGTETSRNQRDPDTALTILSGDIDGNDVVNASGITPSWTALAGSNAYHLMTATTADADTQLDGFTLTGGWAQGGGVDDDGAVIDCGGADPSLGNLTVVGNRSDYRANLNACSSMITGSAFVSNYAGYEAAGLAVDSGALSMVNCLFQGNQAAGAGAMTVQDGKLELINVLFSGNLSGDGAAVFSGAVEGSLINATFSGNRSLGAGGALNILSTGTVDIANSIFWNNQSADGVGILAASISDAGNGSVKVSYSLVQGSGGSSAWTGGTLSDGGANIDRDPRFVAPGSTSSAPTLNGNYRLAIKSPALDSGENVSNSSKIDLDGEERIQNLVIDMGPYEGEDKSSIFADGFENGSTSAWSSTVGG